MARVIKDEGIHNVIVDDYVRHSTPKKLLEEWDLPIDESTEFVTRNSLLKAMEKTGTRPTEWIREREAATGSYPDVEDPDFAAQLTRKKEFAELASKAVAEDTCTKLQDEFEATAVQRLVARFLHPSTPYHSMLLNHGVGVGKTCSAITVAETYLEIFPGNIVYILAPQAIADGFKRTIFDVDKLKPASPEERRLTGDRWKSPQCTGMTYLRLIDMVAIEKLKEDEMKKKIEGDVKAQIRTRYSIMGYLAFAKMLEKMFKDEIPAAIKDKAIREERENDLLRQWFSDHLVIIDEAHNLRDSEADTSFVSEADPEKHKDAAEGKALTPFLKRMTRVAEGMRLLLMTATPMYNAAPEIKFLLNILHVNATKDPLSPHLIQDADLAGGLTKEGEAKLVYLIRRYVSYMRGENPNTFPLRLLPKETAGAAFMATYPTKSISRTEDTVSLTETDKSILAMLPLVVHSVKPTTPIGKILSEKITKYRGDKGRSSEFVLERTMQMANMTYPSNVYGNKGWPIFFQEHAEVATDGTKITQYDWKSVGDPAPTLEDVMSLKNLKQYSPKIASIVDNVTRGEGLSFVFSKYIDGGVLPIAIALELAGWCRVLANGTPAPLLKGNTKRKHFYVILTSRPGVSPNFKGLLNYATSSENKDGKKVKAILGSQITSEGLDLKHIRQIHILDGWYHMNRIEQIEGRGVRFCSHSALPLEKRNCTIFLHAVAVPEYETGDLYAYRLAIKKAQPIGRITQLIKIHSWDCMLNHDAIMLKDMGTRTVVDAFGKKVDEYELQDKPYTSFCDFSNTCEFVCGRTLEKKDWGQDESTYREFDARYKFLKLQERLRDKISKETALPLRWVKDTIYAGIPESIAAIGIREALESMRIRLADGTHGSLILKQGYLLFQPDQVTDTDIPMALRYGRAYRRIPRVFVPQRKQILQRQPARPVVDEEEEEEEEEEDEDEEEGAAAAPRGAEAALDSLRTWIAVVRRVMAEPTGAIAAPPRIKADAFYAWRWLLHHFRAIPETVPTAAHWWMDTIWTSAERIAVLRSWTIKGVDALSEEERGYAALLPELYKEEAVRGFLVVPHTAKGVETYCFAEGDKEPTTLCELYKSRIDKAIGAPVALPPKGKDMAPMYGYLFLKDGVIAFRSVDPKTGNFKGAECISNPKLGYNVERVQTVQREARKLLPAEDPFLVSLLKDDFVDIPEDMKEASTLRKGAVKDRMLGKKEKHPDVTLEYICEMSRLQLCPYFEFILRVLDRRRVGGKRWFLSLVDAARAGMKMN